MYQELRASGILIIVGMCASLVAGLCVIKLGEYNVLFWRFKRKKPNKWRHKRNYRHFTCFASLVAFTMFLTSFILVNTTTKNSHECTEPLCGGPSTACGFGAPYFILLFMMVDTFFTTIGLWFMWYKRFRPVDWLTVCAALEMAQLEQRQKEEAEEWEDYSEKLGKVSVGLGRMIEVEALRRENEVLHQQVQYLSIHGAADGVDLLPPVASLPRSRAASISGRPAPDVDEVASQQGSMRGTHLDTNIGTIASVRPHSPAREQVLVKENAILMKKLKLVEEKWKTEAIARKKLFNEIQDMKGKIRVMGRSRPFLASKEHGQIELVFYDDCTLQVPAKNKEYIFDHVFPPESTQQSVWEECKHMAQSALDGYNVTIFAYGQTGSGKTHTMQGTDEEPGITIRMTDEIFKVCDKVKGTHACEVSCYMMELYLDELYDLLLQKHSINPRDVPKLEIKTDENGAVQVKNATITVAHSGDELMRLYRKGCSQRHTRKHAMNDQSSRSHLIFSVNVQTTNTITGKVLNGKITLVDLAGSERLKKTGMSAAADGAQEAAAINDSLFELGKVISDLSSEHPPQFINKRNNKLTMILSDSLGGNAKTLMIVCMSPATYNLPETINSLDFATRCKKVTNKSEKQEESKVIAKLKADYKRQIDDLQAENTRLRAQLP